MYCYLAYASWSGSSSRFGQRVDLRAEQAIASQELRQGSCVCMVLIMQRRRDVGWQGVVEGRKYQHAWQFYQCACSKAQWKENVLVSKAGPHVCIVVLGFQYSITFNIILIIIFYPQRLTMDHVATLAAPWTLVLQTPQKMCKLAIGFILGLVRVVFGI